MVSVLLPPLCGTRSHLAFATLPLPIPSVAFLKLTASSRLLAPPSDSPKCLRFGLWLTLCTLNTDLLTLLTKCQTASHDFSQKCYNKNPTAETYVFGLRMSQSPMPSLALAVAISRGSAGLYTTACIGDIQLASSKAPAIHTS